MALEIKKPNDIYRWINDELAHIVDLLATPSSDAALNQAQDNARDTLNGFQSELQKQLAELEKNAEWNTFTIAFYGETNAGKSTIIEILRILLQEPCKLLNQQTFRELKRQYDLGEEDLKLLQKTIKQVNIQFADLHQQLSATLMHHERQRCEILKSIDDADVRFGELERHLNTSLQQHEQRYIDALNAIERLRALIAKRKQTASLWLLLSLFRKMPEEIELTRAEQLLPGIAAARDNAGKSLRAQQREAEQSKFALERQLSESAATCDSSSASLLSQQAEVEQNKHALLQQQQESETRLAELLAELEKWADGEIIGDGRADFTRQTQRYNFELDGQSFALLDVPGIEGNEDSISSEIKQAVQTAHAVFYVTNQAAPPQTGNEQRKGTLEKIKAHLGAQTEVWTVFNKKITSPKNSLIGRPLISDDENAGLAALDKNMREQLGEHYCGLFPLTALPAFLASTDHFAPNSQNASRRSKILADFNPEELLEKSRLHAFLQLLSGQLIKDSKDKITRANFNKANEVLKQTTETLRGIQRNFAELSEKLDLDGQSAKAQLSSSVRSLKQRLESCGETLIDNFVSNARKKMYAIIDNDISNDYFKDALKDKIGAQQEELSKQLSAAMSKEVEYFQLCAKDILERFEEQARELTDIYAKLNNTQLNGVFRFKFDLDNGLKVTDLLAVLAGGALLWWNPAGWFVLAMGAASVLVGAYKSVRSFFSSDYKKAEQKKSTDDNLRLVAEQLRRSLYDGLKNALPDLQQKIRLLEQAIEAPIKHATMLEQLLSQSVNQLKSLSRQIDSTGTR